jgi:NTP pyrophosphatase (non-canonical NTP hydrolase)
MGYPSYEKNWSTDVEYRLSAISKWIDGAPANAGKSPLENLLLRTTAKLSEEVGEVGAALIGMTGQNPRKGVTHTIEDVRKELLDVALTALAAVEHISGNNGTTVYQLNEHIFNVYNRMAESNG